MNCERFQVVAGDLARDEIRGPRRGSAGSPAEHLGWGAIPAGVVVMEAGDRERALAHIDECESCAQAWSNQRVLSEGLRSVAAQMKSLRAPVQLEEKLRSALRDRTLARHSRSAPQHWRYWATAAAAALLFVFGLMAWRGHVASLSPPAIEANAKGGTAPQPESQKPEPSSLFAAGGDQSRNESAPPKREVPRPKLAKTQRIRHGDDGAPAKRPTRDAASGLAANTETKEVTTDFVALGYGSAMELQDGGQLVRVELPRSALVRFGLPMNMDRADERVKADVLVGADGLARAIRFVK